MYKMKKCALCNEEKELQLSHIVPNFAGKYLKKTAFSNIRSCENGKVVQDIEKHYMLCHECEELFSDSERWFSNNIFYPWFENGMDSFDYSNKLFYFLTSLSWRSLYIDILDAVENSWLSVDELECLINSEHIMKDFLVGNRDDIKNIEHHIFFFERIKEVCNNQEMFSSNPHATIHRSITSYTTCYKKGTYFTITNMEGIIIVTFYKKDKDEKWIGTKIYNGSGTLIVRGQQIQSVVGQEINSWLELAKKQAENMSEKQKEKLNKKISDAGEDIKNYKIYQDYVDDMNLK